MRTLPSSTHDRRATAQEKREALIANLKQWWDEETTDWDSFVTGETDVLPGGVDLWDSIPEVDSKVVARTSPIFEAHLGLALKVDLIRKGGYASFDDFIQDLIPKMERVAEEQFN